jgi:hypothetical protein
MTTDLQNYTEEYLDFDHVSEGGGGLPDVGEYICRLSKLDPTTSKKGDPMVNASFDVLEGKFEGHTIKFYFWLGAKLDPKTRRVFAPGAAQIKQSLAAIGAPLDAETLKRFPRDANKAAKLFGTPFYNKRVRIRVLNKDENRKNPDTGIKEKQTVKVAAIVGLATAAAGSPEGTQAAAENTVAGIV